METTRQLADRRDQLSRVAVAIAFSVVFALIVWRAFRGLDWTDEPFYAVETWRLVLGDSLFKDIWSSSQLSSAITVPLVAAYVSFAGGTEGILLFLRLAYTIACALVAFLLYSSTRNFAGRFWALLACIPVFASISPTAFSYNTIQLLGFFIACALLFAAQNVPAGRKRFLCIVGAGIACGTAFVAYPTTLLALPIFCAWLLLEPGLGKSVRTRVSNLLPFAIGCALCLLALAAFIVINSSFSALVDNLNYMLPAEKSESRSLINYSLNVLSAYGKKLAVILLASCALAHASTLVKNPRTRRVLQALALAGAIAIVVWQCVRVANKISVAQVQVQMYFAMASIGPVLFLLNERRWSQGIWMFLAGIVLSVAVYFGTTNQVNWYVYPHTLSASAVVLYFPSLADKAELGRKALNGLAGFAIAFTLIAVSSFCLYVYRDDPLQDLDTMLESGPGAGLITTADRADLYYHMVDTIREYAPDQGTMLFEKVFPFGYLCTTATPAAGNSFKSNPNGSKLALYYEKNPERIPSTIFFVSSDYFGETNGNVELGGFFEDYARSHPHSAVVTPEATIVQFDSLP